MDDDWSSRVADYEYMSLLESKIANMEFEIEDLQAEVQRLGCALMAAGVPAAIVEKIQKGV